MADSPVVGSVAFEVRGKTATLMADLQQAGEQARARIAAIEAKYGTIALKGDSRGLNSELLSAEKATRDTMQRLAREYGLTAAEGQRAFGDASRAMSQSMRDVETQTHRSADGIKQALHEVAGEVAVLFSAEKVAEYADEWTRLTNALKVAGLEGRQLANTQTDLVNIANRNGVSIDSLSGLYRQLGIASKQIGTSDADNTRIAAGFAAAMRIQGTSAATAEYATMEFGHALEETRVQARAFNALQFEMPVVLQAISKHIDQAGGSVSKLRQLILDGEVSNKDFGQAFLYASKELEEQAQKVQLTISGAFETIKNNLIEYIGTTGQASGATAAITGAIQALGDNLGTVIPAVEIIAAAFGVKWVAGMAAAEGSLLAVTIAQARHLVAVAQGNAALNEAAEAELVAARAAVTAADTEVAASVEVVNGIEARIAALREEAAAYEANIVLAAEQRAAARADVVQSQANRAAGFGNIIVGAGEKSAPLQVGSAAGDALGAEAAGQASRAQLARVTEELTTAEAALAVETAVMNGAMEASTAGQIALKGAIARTTVASTVGAAAMTAFDTAIEFVGGPIGAAVLALVAGLIALSGASAAAAKAMADAEKHADDFRQKVEDATGKGAEFRDVIARLTQANNDTAGAAHNAAEAFRDQATAADLASKAVANMNAREREKRVEEIDRDNARIKNALNSTAGVDFSTGNITFAENPQQKAQNIQARLARSLGAPAFGELSDQAVADARRNPEKLTQAQQDLMTAYNAAVENLNVAKNTITQNNIERKSITSAKDYVEPAAKSVHLSGKGDEADLTKAEEDARVAQAGPDKRAAIEAERTSNYLKERKKLTDGLTAGTKEFAAAEKQAADYADRMRSNQIATLNQRDAKKGVSAGAKADSAESTATSQSRTYADQEAKAKEQSAKAAIDQAKAALESVASDTTLDDQTRRARIDEAAANLRSANAAGEKLQLELDRIEQARKDHDAEIALNSKLNAAQKATVTAASDRAATAQAQAARDLDAAKQAEAAVAAEKAITAQRIAALQAQVADEGLTVAQRAAAERQLISIQQTQARTTLQATLSARGVSPEAQARALAGLDTAEEAKASEAADNRALALRTETLRTTEGLAKSTSERAAIEAELLRLAQEQRRAATDLLAAQVDAAVRSGSITAGEGEVKKSSLYGAQSAAEGAENKAQRRKALSPIGAYQASLNQTPGQINDSLQAIAVDGLKGFNEGLVQAITSAKDLGSAFHDVAMQIVTDLLRIGIEQEITKPLATALFGSQTNAAPSLNSDLRDLGIDPGKGSGGSSGGGFLSTVLGGIGHLFGFADGRVGGDGKISGPGTGTSDSVLALMGQRPIRVSTDESIMTAKATRDYGPTLRAMNAGRLPAFADGYIPSLSLPSLDYSSNFSRSSAGSDSSASARRMEVSVNLAGANGDAAIEAAVHRGVSTAVAVSIAHTNDTVSKAQKASARASRQTLPR